MIALFNFNSYLGGGETLFVRMANFLEKQGENYILFLKKGSYIEGDLLRIGIPDSRLHAVEREIDYYYLKKEDRELLLDEIEVAIPRGEDCYLVSFCTRDLYTVCELNNRNSRYRISHLILHNQDNLYVCQTILDKFISKYMNNRQFSSKQMIDFNAQLFTEVSKKYALIPQNDIQVKLWGERFGIPLDYEKVVPLPTYDFNMTEEPTISDRSKEKKIIWIGRFVDFKLPALCAMIRFVSTHPDYYLTIVGKGDDKSINNYVHRHGLDTSRMTFVGEVQYSELGGIIKNHSIGYAMGTSIVEIGKYGIPVIMALGNPSFQFFDKDVCGGLYDNVGKGNVGDNLYLNDNEALQPTIEDTISTIEKDYVKSTEKCYAYIKRSFDLNTNIDSYIRIIRGCEIHHQIDCRIPQSSGIRRLLYSCFK